MVMTNPILVADIGGTNARFALAERTTSSLSLSHSQSYRAEDFETIGDAGRAYLESVQVQPTQACLAIAAPVKADIVPFTNSHWILDKADLKSALDLENLVVINDFFALAASVSALPENALLGVKEGDPEVGAPQLVIGPGTGLGQALVIPCGGHDQIVPTEGGHVSFAPRTDEELAVMKFIAEEHPRVSVERLLSGRGLVNIHRALCAIAGEPRANLQSNEITAAAQNGTHPIAAQTVDMFCAVLGRVVGDAVLGTGATGGVILGGGILPKIKDLFLDSKFIDRFLDKGRMRTYLEPVPIHLIHQEGAALYGAASHLYSLSSREGSM